MKVMDTLKSTYNSPVMRAVLVFGIIVSVAHSVFPSFYMNLAHRAVKYTAGEQDATVYAIAEYNNDHLGQHVLYSLLVYIFSIALIGIALQFPAMKQILMSSTQKATSLGNKLLPSSFSSS